MMIKYVFLIMIIIIIEYTEFLFYKNNLLLN